MSWKEFYKINKEKEFEKYEKGTTLSFWYIKENIFGHLYEEHRKIEIDLMSPKVKGVHLKQIIKKSEKLTCRLSQISVLIYSVDRSKSIEDKNFLNLYDIKENSNLAFTIQEGDINHSMPSLQDKNVARH